MGIPQIGVLEIAIVLVIALLVFGPKRLPDLGRSLGKGIREFREGVSSIGSDHDHDEIEPTDHHSLDEPEQGRVEAAGLESGAMEVEVEEITAGPEPSDAGSRD